MKDSLGREPRWNADRCAPPRWGARSWPTPRQNTYCVCRRFASDSLSFFRSFVARMERSAIREHDRSGAGYPGFRFASSGLHFAKRIRRRPKAGSTTCLSSLSALALNLTVACHNSGAKTRRDNGILFSPLVGREPAPGLDPGVERINGSARSAAR